MPARVHRSHLKCPAPRSRTFGLGPTGRPFVTGGVPDWHVGLGLTVASVQVLPGGSPPPFLLGDFRAAAPAATGLPFCCDGVRPVTPPWEWPRGGTPGLAPLRRLSQFLWHDRFIQAPGPAREPSQLVRCTLNRPSALSLVSRPPRFVPGAPWLLPALSELLVASLSPAGPFSRESHLRFVPGASCSCQRSVSPSGV